MVYNKKINILIFLLFVFISGCNKIEINKTSKLQNKDIENIYRYYWGLKDGFQVWIVDGAIIRKNIFNEFVYGGNDERYPFVPGKEIWIDNSISSEEFETTLAHEINERDLMAKFEMTYFDAHDSSLALELQMRRNYSKVCENHEIGLKKVAPIDFDSTQEIEDLPELIKLKNIYRVPYGERNSVKIWIVDGYEVRKNIYPDFGFSGNGKAYHFIPDNEIWIDASVTCEETEYSISLEIKERELMSKGLDYDSAYLEAVKVSDNMRNENEKKILAKNKIVIPEKIVRDTGTNSKK
jgi:hypothetical protein